MNKQTLRECCELSAVLAKETDWTPFAIADLVAKLVGWAQRHARLMEHACNEPTDDAFETRVARLEKCIQENLPQGITAIFSGDPRGATVKLKLPSGRSNSWGGEGWCVPGS